MSGSVFEKTNISDTKFDNSKLVGVIFSQIKKPTIAPSFNNANLSESLFTLTNLSGAKFNKAILFKVRIDIAEFEQCSFNGANLSYSTFRNVFLWKADFQDADLSFANFDLHEPKLIFFVEICFEQKTNYAARRRLGFSISYEETQSREKMCRQQAEANFTRAKLTGITGLERYITDLVTNKYLIQQNMSSTK